jgi:uncharacterized protein (DUF362 family)
MASPPSILNKMLRVGYHKLPGEAEYPRRVPFDPPEIYPEFFGGRTVRPILDRTNNIYPAVRNLLLSLGLDSANKGTGRWNPFREFVGEGQNVLLKPNLVTHHHPHGEDGIFCMISHPSVIRTLLDYARLAVGPSGRVTVGDTPIENCEFDVLCRVTKLDETIGILRDRGDRNLELLDFRTFRTTQYPDSSVVKTILPGDPRGYTDIHLGRQSLFQELEDKMGEQNYYTLGDHTVDHMDPYARKKGLPNRHHNNGRHVYRIPNTILESDFVINLAKLKTHKFSGVTLCLKNAVGICQGKEYLPHRRPGTPEEGGDSFPSYPSNRYIRTLRMKRAAYSLLGGRNSLKAITFLRNIFPAKPSHEIYSEPLFGDWHGNNTVWRMTLDLNLVLFHANRQGVDFGRAVRSFFGVIDGIVGMDHEAPMAGMPVTSNVIVAGRDPVAVDIVGTQLMSFDPMKIPTITGVEATQCRQLGKLCLEETEVVGNVPIQIALSRFVPTKGWKDHLFGGRMHNTMPGGVVL